MQKRMDEEKKYDDQMIKEGRKFANTFYKEHPEIFDYLFDKIISEMGEPGCQSPFSASFYGLIEDGKYKRVNTFMSEVKKELKELIYKEFVNALSVLVYSINIDVEYDYTGRLFYISIKVELKIED